jgi:hypothetical protein
MYWHARLDRAPDHVFRSAGARKRHDQIGLAFVEHPLIAQWASFLAEFVPLALRDLIRLAWDAPALLGAEMHACERDLHLILTSRPWSALRLRPDRTAWRCSPQSAALSQFDRRVIPLIRRRFRVSNSIQIQNSRRPKVTTCRALSPSPDTHSARFVCVKKIPAPNAGVFFMRLGLASANVRFQG